MTADTLAQEDVQLHVQNTLRYVVRQQEKRHRRGLAVDQAAIDKARQAVADHKKWSHP